MGSFKDVTVGSKPLSAASSIYLAFDNQFHQALTLQVQGQSSSPSYAPLMMLASIASPLSVLSAISLWVNCCIFAVSTQTVYKRNTYSPTRRPTARPSSELRVNGSCQPGAGREHHEVVKSSGEVWPYQVYKSSLFNPPELDIVTNGKPLAPGLLLISPSDATPVKATKDTAPMIMTETGQLVWHGPMVNANNFRVASYEGHPILSFWSGSSPPGANVGHGYGKVTFLDRNYNEVLNVCLEVGLRTTDNVTYPCQADFHESYVTERDTLIVTAYNVTESDLSSIGGPSSGWVFDSLFFELDPRSGDILFQWSALEHIPVNETKLKFTGRSGFNQSVPFDWFHINSVVNIGNQFLVNSRHLWTTYLITAKGNIRWTLQGETGGDFGALPPNGQFTWQHFPRPYNITPTSITISYFNNFNALGIDNGTHPSNGLVLQLALPPSKSNHPVLLDYFSNPKHSFYSGSQGSTSLLPNGNFLLEYGQIPVITEFGPSGQNSSDIRWTARFGLDNLVQSYRGYKSSWQGFPTTTPDLAVEEESNGCHVGYVSWNGATNVQAWVVYEGWFEDRLSQVDKVKNKGFETQFPVGQPCVQVAAIVNGEVSKRSDVVCNFTNETRHGWVVP